MKSRLKSRRGIIDLLLAGLLAIGSMLLPAVQSGKAFNRSSAPGTTVVINP